MTIILLIDDESVPITNMYDEDGDEVTEWEEAFTFVAGPFADGHWLSADVADYRETVPN